MEIIYSYKIRIYPNKTQISIIERTLGACRYIYNNYLFKCKEYYNKTGKFLDGFSYSKLLTNWKKKDNDYIWLKDISSKAIHEAFMDASDAMCKFFEKKSGFPRWKSKRKNPVTGYYFIGDRIKFKHNKVNLPILKWVRITENTYVPNKRVIGGTIKKENDKYYAIFRIEIDNSKYKFKKKEKIDGFGIDLGIEDFAIISNTKYDTFKEESFLNDDNIIYYENKIKELQRKISNKYEINKKKKGKTNYSNNCIKLQKKINSYHEKIHNYKKNKIDNFVSTLVKLKPKYITIEDLDIKGMLTKDSSYHILHNHIQKSMFKYFRDKLIEKSHLYGFEVRVANKFFASSKICFKCGNKKKDLKLSDRVYKCDKCGWSTGRDINASLNLVDLKKYSIA